MMASSGNRVNMDQSKQTSVILTNNINQQPADNNNNNPRAVQRCPRCDSSNTKFCYYNNYSLSQPRHFCKACKRYWTRGGTLRNVPVGGGCRKNKRIKKPNSSSITTSQQLPGISKAAGTSTNHHGTSLFYGNLPSNQLSDINNLTIPRSPLSFVFTRETLANNGYDDNILQPQLSGLGLNFSSTYLSSSSSGANIDNINGYKNVFNPISTTSNSLLSNFSLFGTTSTTLPLVTSSLENEKLNWGGAKESISIPTSDTHYQDLPFELGENVSSMVSVKVAESVETEDENIKNKLDWSSPLDQNSSLMNDQPNNINNNGSADNNSSIFWNSLSVSGGGGTNNWSDDLPTMDLQYHSIL